MEGECVTKESRLQREMIEMYQEETTVQLVFSRASQCQPLWDVFWVRDVRKREDEATTAGMS